MKELLDLQAKYAISAPADALTLARTVKVLQMAADEVIYFTRYNFTSDVWDGGAYPAVLIGDAFNQGVDDGESFTLADTDKIYDLYMQYGYDGLLAWVAKKRAATPTREFQTPEYTAARRIA